MIVRVPASSANLGPGFDALGMALRLPLEAGLVGAGTDPPVEGAHPAARGLPRRRRLRVGVGPFVHPRRARPRVLGRGADVAGIVLALHERRGADLDLAVSRAGVLALATELEGHADNMAASLFGGVVATAGGEALRVPLAVDPAVITWVPASTTSTRESRTRLATTVSFDDAVFNVGRVALLVAALATGDVEALRTATEDRLHQDARLADAEPSRAALSAALEAGAWCGWLSGSGPTVASLCAPGQAKAVAAALPPSGSVKILRIDGDGALLVPGSA